MYYYPGLTYEVIKDLTLWQYDTLVQDIPEIEKFFQGKSTGRHPRGQQAEEKMRQMMIERGITPPGIM